MPAAVGTPAVVPDVAYTKPSPGGIPADTTLTDPSFTDTKAYTMPSLGGEFGPGKSLLLGGQADGGQAALDAAITITVTAPIVPTPPHAWPGRASNPTTFLNLFPWHKVPPQGLDQNNPAP
jgi:hypothetical protein